MTNGDIGRKGAGFWLKIIRLQKLLTRFFETVTDSLNLLNWSSKVNVSDDKVQGIIFNISNHPSIL